MTIDKVYIDEQTIVRGESGISLFKYLPLPNKSKVGFNSTIQNIDNPDSWLVKDQPLLKQFYLTIYCHLSVTISRQRPQEDEGVNIITKSSFIIAGNLNKDFDDITLKVLAQLYGTSAAFCFSEFASDRKRLHKTERMTWLTPQEILADLKKKEELLPTFLDKLHHL